MTESGAALRERLREVSVALEAATARLRAADRDLERLRGAHSAQNHLSYALHCRSAPPPGGLRGHPTPPALRAAPPP